SLYALGGHPVRADEALRFRLVQDHFVVVPVMVNGEGPFDFLLDTGTNATIIDLALNKQLALQASDSILLMTVAGSQAVPRSLLQRLALGAKAVENLEILCGDLRDLRSLDAGIRGVLGQNFLSRFNYILNYGERRIEFEEGCEMERALSGARLAFEDDEGMMIVATEPASPKEKALRLVLDSGISSLVIFDASIRRLGYDVEFGASLSVRASTNFGSMDVRPGRIRRLKVGSETFRDLPLVLAEGFAVTQGRSIDGLLPARLFRSIYFNHKTKMLILNPRPPAR
ncbi:MAG TPA: retroviral-like aspartic protease family protein, partial [Pyrinomonadaceae bacterium]|nr:retroviral-like aspartic protease family protein [Pyrinomonadaceae bacterium]